MVVVLSGNRINSLVDLLAARYLLSIAACELLPHLSMPSNKMNAPRFVADTVPKVDIDSAGVASKTDRSTTTKATDMRMQELKFLLT